MKQLSIEATVANILTKKSEFIIHILKQTCQTGFRMRHQFFCLDFRKCFKLPLIKFFYPLFVTILSSKSQPPLKNQQLEKAPMCCPVECCPTSRKKRKKRFFFSKNCLKYLFLQNLILVTQIVFQLQIYIFLSFVVFFAI